MNQGGISMTIPNETLIKMQSLPSEKLNIVINLVNQMALSNPVDVFDALCEDGAKNPMSESEVEEFVSKVRAERNVTCN